MKPRPDWITGGDPIRTHWMGGTDLLAGHDLHWQPLGEWVEGEDKLTVSLSYAKNGTIVVLRIQGRISRTARNLFSEVGWCIDSDSPPEIPILSPGVWQESWLALLHGEINEQEIFDRLGNPTGGGKVDGLGFRPPQPSEAGKTASRGILIVLALLAAVTCGFAAGWVINSRSRIPTSPIPEIPSNSTLQPK